MTRGAKRVLVIRRKRLAPPRQAGGQWKVAYADFVTAMMAFFMVMWIMGMDQNTRELIEGYFTNPAGFRKGFASGHSPLLTGTAPVTVQPAAVRFVTPAERARRAEAERLASAGVRIRASLARAVELDSVARQVEIAARDEGLRIELVEGSGGETFFGLGSAALTPAAERALGLIAEELAALDNPLVIEGHTDAVPFAAGGPSNWELSAARANAARRVLERHRVAPSRILEVRGLADRRPRIPERPRDPANRRISILLPVAR